MADDRDDPELASSSAPAMLALEPPARPPPPSGPAPGRPTRGESAEERGAAPAIAAPAGEASRLRAALEQLVAEARARLRRHPGGHLAGPGAVLELQLSVPIGGAGSARAAAELSATLDSALADLVAHEASFRPGRVLCLRCGDAACGHARPASAREVFAGYGPSGLPRFVDFGQLLLELRDPRIDQLFGTGDTTLLTRPLTARELTASLLPAFQPPPSAARLHVQVVAGWYRAPASGEPLAVTFQILSSSRPRAAARSESSGREPRRGAPPRFGLNVIGVGPGGEPLERLWDPAARGGERHRTREAPGAASEPPWSEAVRWAQGALGSLGSLETRGRGGGEAAAPDQLAIRLRGIVAGFARRLERPQRGQRRRTLHGEERHRSGERPTGMALADLAQARAEQLLFDTRRRTLIVLGERGRAHVFSPAGKLVTSIRTTPDVIQRRRDLGRWRLAEPHEVEELRARMETADGPP